MPANQGQDNGWASIYTREQVDVLDVTGFVRPKSRLLFWAGHSGLVTAEGTIPFPGMPFPSWQTGLLSACHVQVNIESARFDTRVERRRCGADLA